jgi:hypothetical protein
MTTVAVKVYIAQKLIDIGLIKTPDHYIEFLDADLGCENSLKLIYELLELEKMSGVKSDIS